MLRRAFILIAIAGLCACGRSASLRPAQGEPLPVKPLMAGTTPDADQLLTPPPYADPERIDELVRRSQPRKADRFDLPPANGGAAPLPANTGESSMTNELGPVAPE